MLHESPEDILNGMGATTERSHNANVSYRCMADIETTLIDWLWRPNIARGKLTIISGDPGLGKSQLTIFLAATVSLGGAWPIDDAPCPKGNVVLLNCEDDAADTIKPRLEAVGADMSRVFILDAVKGDSGRERAFNLDDDLANLEAMLVQIGGAVLVVIDPVSAYMGGADSHNNADVRAVLGPLAALASKHSAAIVAVTHNNKSIGGRAMGKVMGSMAFVAAARAAFSVMGDPQNPERRLFLPLKNNIGNDKAGYAFVVEGVTLPSSIETSRIVWDGEHVTMSADEAMAGPEGGNQRGVSALDDAVAFLKSELSEEWTLASDLQASAEGHGISKSTLKRAKMNPCFEKKKIGDAWAWRSQAVLADSTK